ncbi:MAG: hypothetical protein RBR06_09335 [Desulfuromonadaceae bacterium]|nr:hypothetical protein [Desulfuromonadaceae bacterium]
MRKVLILIVLLSVCAVGCAPANITAVSWPSKIDGDNVQTRCERVDMRSSSQMKKVFSQYDGWNLVYISEYTTGNKLGTDAAVCFERKIK